MTNDLFNMRLSPEYLRWLDDMRRKEEDIPTRSEMARRCIERQARDAGVVERTGVLAESGDDGKAVRIANAAVKKRGKSGKAKSTALRGALRGTY